jgi:4-amino-4-deoxychorismate lyase
VKIEFLETIKVFNGELCHIDYHQERYERTLRSFGIKDFIELQEVLLPPKKGLYRCRVVYGLNSQLTQHYYRYEKREIKQLKLIESETISYEKKYANREELDELFSKRGECDDIIIVKNGLLSDTTIANIAFYDEKQWWTPRRALLAGTTRKRLLERGFLKERDIRVEDLRGYSQFAVMNAMVDFDIITDKKIEEIIC